MSSAAQSTYKLIRDLWPQKSIYDMLLSESAFLGQVKKDTDFGEKIRYINVGTGGGQGTSPVFGTAKANKTASTAEEFAVQKVSYYGLFSIDGLIMRTVKHTGDKAYLVNPCTRESKNLMQTVKNDYSSFIHGNGGGAIGRILSTSTLASQVITLDSGADRRRFQKGMVLQASTTDGTSGAVLTGTVSIASVGGTATAPTITINEATWSGAIAGLTTTSYLFREGCFGAVFSGLDAWCPSHSGSPSTFKGVTRTNDANNLAGLCLTATSMSPIARILEANRMVVDQGGEGETYLMSTRNWMNLQNEMQASGRLNFTKAPAASVGKYTIGVQYNGIEVMGTKGIIKVFADPWMPDNVERCLTLDAWTLASLGEMVHWDTDVGPDNPMVEESADAREVRLVSDLNLICEAPGYNCRVAVTA